MLTLTINEGLFIGVLLNIVGFLAILNYIYIQFDDRKRLSLIAMHFLFFAIGLIFIYYRENLPAFISIIFSNGLMLTGLMAFISGIRLTLKKPIPYLNFGILLILYLGLMVFFTYSSRNLIARVFIGELFTTSLLVYLLLIILNEQKYNLTLPTFRTVIFVTILTHFARVINLFVSRVPNYFLDFDADSIFIITLSILGFLLVVGVEELIHTLIQKDKEKLLKDVRDSQILLEASLNSPKDMLVLSLDHEYKYLYYNDNHKNTMHDIYGVNIKEGDCILDLLVVEEDRKKAKEYYDIALNGKTHSTIDKYGENQDIYFEAYYNPIYDENNKIIGVSVFGINVTEQRNKNKEIAESEQKFRLIYSTMSQGLVLHDAIYNDKNEVVDFRIIEGNESYFKFINRKREDVIGLRLKENFPKLESYWLNTYKKVLKDQVPKYYENYSVTLDKHIALYCYPVKENQIASLMTDITDRVKRDKEIEYLSYNDQLTGLYNRRFYEEKLIELDTIEHLPLSLVMGDVNGLKLVNDSFGHQVGDELLKKVSTIFKEACRTSDYICRIGGDEFMILLPQTNYKKTEKIIDRINAIAKDCKVEHIGVSISFGYGTKTKTDQDLNDIFTEIENEMYKRKLSESTSMRNKTVDVIMSTLYEKNDRESNHSKRVGELCSMLAKADGHSDTFIKQIATAGLMHDIGKIGIDDHALNKTGSLTNEEWEEVKKHPDIGFRILGSLNEFYDIAQFVLEHHESWDGSGYPKGIKGENITLQARMIKICDAYDAMTVERPYKKAKTKEEAIQELLNYKGIMFDPRLTDLFISKVLDSE